MLSQAKNKLIKMGKRLQIAKTKNFSSIRNPTCCFTNYHFAWRDPFQAAKISIIAMFETSVPWLGNIILMFLR